MSGRSFSPECGGACGHFFFIFSLRPSGPPSIYSIQLPPAPYSSFSHVLVIGFCYNFLVGSSDISSALRLGRVLPIGHLQLAFLLYRRFASCEIGNVTVLE
ncbi:hypothetical protein J3459_007736 [Metarhizium acridum]|nr:hypothetical protein J3459_007736 [Metarhizium acridum]